MHSLENKKVEVSKEGNLEGEFSEWGFNIACKFIYQLSDFLFKELRRLKITKNYPTQFFKPPCVCYFRNK